MLGHPAAPSGLRYSTSLDRLKGVAIIKERQWRADWAPPSPEAVL